MADGTEEIDCSNSNGIDLDECSCFCGLPLCGPSVVQSSEDATELDDSCFLDGCQQHRFVVVISLLLCMIYCSSVVVSHCLSLVYRVWV